VIYTREGARRDSYGEAVGLSRRGQKAKMRVELVVGVVDEEAVVAALDEPSKPAGGRRVA